MIEVKRSPFGGWEWYVRVRGKWSGRALRRRIRWRGTVLRTAWMSM